MPIHVLATVELAPERLAALEGAGFELRFATAPDRRAEMLRGPDAAQIRAVVTNGATGFSAAEMDALPSLEIVCAIGAGHENIDLPAARDRKIVVTHGPGTNDASVADHAMALLMAAVRAIPQADAAVRRGEWTRSRDPRPTISGKRLGILGLGNIGSQIARRGAAGFGMPVGYHSRQPRPDIPYGYFPSPVALAEWCDFLIVAAPGGGTTRHLVDGPVLHALGPAGFLVNIGRGSVVDTAAVIEALQGGRIAGAALDVIEGEPDVPAELARCPNLVLTPHMAGRSPEAMRATAALLADNLAAHFAGRPVLTPVRVPGA